MLKTELVHGARLAVLAVGVTLAWGATTPAVAFQALAVTAPAAPRPSAGLPGHPPDRYVIELPPAYPRPPAGFVPLPASGPTRIFLDRPSPQHGHVWAPGRTEVIVGVDATGRIIHVLEWIPGRFERDPAGQSPNPR